MSAVAQAPQRHQRDAGEHRSAHGSPQPPELGQGFCSCGGTADKFLVLDKLPLSVQWDPAAGPSRSVGCFLLAAWGVGAALLACLSILLPGAGVQSFCLSRLKERPDTAKLCPSGYSQVGCVQSELLQQTPL